MKEWLDEKIMYLYPLIGRALPTGYLFEPTNEFYGKLEGIGTIPSLEELDRRLDKNEPPITTLEEAAKSIIKYLGISKKPEIVFSPVDGATINSHPAAGRIEISRIRTLIRISPDYMGKPLQLGTILAHEITHDFLYSKDITLPNPNENERLTDLASIMLGLGKLVLNGMEERSGVMGKKLCYLSSSDLAYTYYKINRLYNIPPSSCFANLTHYAYSKVKPLFDEENVKMAKSKLNEINENFLKLQVIMEETKKKYLRILDNQQLINKNLAFIKIERKDGDIFVDINNYLFLHEFERLIPIVEKNLREIKEKVYNTTITVDTIVQQIKDFENLENQIEQETGKMEKLLEKISEWVKIQENYFPKKEGREGIFPIFKKLLRMNEWRKIFQQH